MRKTRLFVMLFLAAAISIFAAQKPQISFQDLFMNAELNLENIQLAKQAALEQGVPLSIFTVDGYLMDVLGVEKGLPVYSVLNTRERSEASGRAMFYAEIEETFNLEGARINHGNGIITNPTLGFPQPAAGEYTEDDLVLIPESSNDAVMAFDKYSGDLVDASYITSSGELSTPIEATISPWGFYLISDQLKDGCMSYDMDGNYITFFAPAGGANPSICDNVRGHNYHPVTGNLLVTSASGANIDAVAEFDSDGNYLGNFIESGLGGIDGPWDLQFRDNDVLISASSSDVHRYDLDGNYLDDFCSVSFPEQLMELDNGNIAVAVFTSPKGVNIFDADGNPVTVLSSTTSLRGLWQLQNGNFLVTHGGGVDEIDGTTGALVRIVVDGVSARSATELGAGGGPGIMTIGEARIDADGDFFPDLEGDTVTVKGVVNSINFTASANRFSYYIQDATGGLNITKGSETGGGPVYEIGDQIIVEGEVGAYAGSVQLNLDSTMLANIQLVNQGVAIDPMTITIAEYLADGEAYEGMYIRFENVFPATGSDPWPGAGSSANMTITDGISEVTLRIDSDSDIDENPEPTWPVNLSGISTQYSWSTPPNDGYQISPNAYTDFNETGFQPEFLTEVNVYDAGGMRVGNTISFGLHDDATDGLDETLGEIELPPLPPAGVFDVRFMFPDGVTASLVDVRSTNNEEVTWDIAMQPGLDGYPITLTWDPMDFPDGTFMLKDALGIGVVTVNMKSTDMVEISNTAITALKIEYTTETTVEFGTMEGWNMLSVPLAMDDMSTATLFPDAVTAFYAFDNGYTTVTELTNGIGYWAKFDAAANHSFTGMQVVEPIPIVVGWNMVGIYDYEVDVNDITTDPAGIFSSQFFKFDSGYLVADMLYPGAGYWVKADQAGWMIPNLPVGKRNPVVNEINSAWSKIIITDATGSSRTLYISNEKVAGYQLPPAPPEGVFDVRYSTGSMVEAMGMNTVMMNSAQYPVKVRVEGADVKVSDNIGGSILSTTLTDGKETVISNSAVTSFVVEGTEVPEVFALEQNYPNPFNPATKIRFSIPVNAKVTLTIFNALGQKVSTLASADMEAGIHTVNFDASSIASGIYFYTISAEGIDGSNFSNTKKMILMK